MPEAQEQTRATHTAGPLNVEIRTAGYFPPSELKYVITKGAAYTALVPAKPDAILYAAAPDLLEGCRKAMTCASINSDVRALIAEAIAKAEGR
jgi:hypothetical protein